MSVRRKTSSSPKMTRPASPICASSRQAATSRRSEAALAAAYGCTSGARSGPWPGALPRCPTVIPVSTGIRGAPSRSSARSMRARRSSSMAISSFVTVGAEERHHMVFLPFVFRRYTHCTPRARTPHRADYLIVRGDHMGKITGVGVTGHHHCSAPPLQCGVDVHSMTQVVQAHIGRISQPWWQVGKWKGSDNRKVLLLLRDGRKRGGRIVAVLGQDRRPRIADENTPRTMSRRPRTGGSGQARPRSRAARAAAVREWTSSLP